MISYKLTEYYPTGSYDGQLELMDFSSGLTIRYVAMHRSIYCITGIYDTLVSAGFGATIYVWNALTLTLRGQLQGAEESIYAVKVISKCVSNVELLAATGRRCTIWVWDLTSYALLLKVPSDKLYRSMVWWDNTASCRVQLPAKHWSSNDQSCLTHSSIPQNSFLFCGGDLGGIDAINLSSIHLIARSQVDSSDVEETSVAGTDGQLQRAR